MAPRSEVPDTTVLITVIRRPELWLEFRKGLRSGRTWLSTVVVAELYAGTRSRDEAAVIGRLLASMGSRGHILVPTSEEWARAGQLIARRTRPHGELRPRDHLADLLILLSAARLKGTVVTANVRHFAPWLRLAGSAGFDVTVTPFGG